MRAATIILRLASLPVGVLIGLWTARLTSLQPCPPEWRCPGRVLVYLPTFATWQCALFGAGACVALLLVAAAVHRLALRYRRRSDGANARTASPEIVEGST
jgi:hypothetical protein